MVDLGVKCAVVARTLIASSRATGSDRSAGGRSLARRRAADLTAGIGPGPGARGAARSGAPGSCQDWPVALQLAAEVAVASGPDPRAGIKAWRRELGALA
jgi:hypothetical protein